MNSGKGTNKENTKKKIRDAVAGAGQTEGTPAQETSQSGGRVLDESSKKRLILIITVAAIALVLIIVYFAVIRPLTESEEGDSGTDISLIWEDEVNYANGNLMLFEHITRDDIDRVEIHNPSNARLYGEQYVDWGIYRYHSDGDVAEGEADENGCVDGEFYLIGYEYAPYDSTKIAYFFNAAGMTICSARLEDHCSDYSKYGLSFEDEADALYYTITKTDGVSYKVYIGNMLPSGNGYYVRVAGSSKLLETGEVMDRDSVYILSNTYTSISLLTYAPYITDTYITYPLDLNSQSTLDLFLINDYYTGSTFSAMPTKSSSDPFSPFSGSSIYYTVEPKGYYASSAFEEMASILQEFRGETVLELGVPMTYIAEETGEEYTDYGLPQETLAKYGLDTEHYRYELTFYHLGIMNDVIFSDLIDNDHYYAYSLVFNTLLYVSYESAAFLRWEPTTYINTQPFNLSIYNCESIRFQGSYVDLGVEYPERKGLQTVDESFRIAGTSANVSVTRLNTGENIERYNFSRLYLQFLYLNMREQLPDDEVQAIINGGNLGCTVTVVTRATTVYKTDAAGNETTEVNYVLPSVTRIYRFYPYSGGRSLVTIESIDQNGVSQGEVGSYYTMTSKIDQVLSSAISVANGITIDGNERY